MASATPMASVPSRPSWVPAAILISGRGLPCSICSDNSTAASASAWEWETATIPTRAIDQPSRSAVASASNR